VASGLGSNDLLLNTRQQQLPFGQGQPQIGDIDETIGPVDLHDLDGLFLTVSPGSFLVTPLASHQTWRSQGEVVRRQRCHGRHPDTEIPDTVAVQITLYYNLVVSPGLDHQLARDPAKGSHQGEGVVATAHDRVDAAQVDLIALGMHEVENAVASVDIRQASDQEDVGTTPPVSQSAPVPPARVSFP
jgi:hypothetical protein